MKTKRFVSTLLALLLICSLPVSAFAEEYDLSVGSVTVNATESGQTVTHGSNAAVPDSAPVITQSNSSTPTSNTITITATENATANVTLSGVNIDTSGAAVEIKGNGDVVIELDGSNNVQSGDNHAGVEKNTTAATETELANGNGKLTITDETGTDGSLMSTGGLRGSGIGGGRQGDGSNITITGSAEVTAQGGRVGSGIGGGRLGSGSNITIEGSAEVDAKGGESGSGIGGGLKGSGSNITITGSAEVTAQGGRSGSGIGGGLKGSGSNITITGSAEVTAKGGTGGSGIGGGADGSGSEITISGTAEVTAKGGESGSGIGGGSNGNGNSTGSNITVSGDAQVKAQGGNQHVELGQNYRGAGAAIGNGGEHRYGAVANPGDDVTPKTDDLNEGWVATYAPGTTDLDTATPDSLTYRDASGTVQTATQNNNNITIEAAELATSDTHGHEAGFKVDNQELVAVTTHNYGDYEPDKEATCTHEGTESAKCTVPGCTAKLERTIPGSMKQHEFVNYVPDADNLATCTEAGTKTAKCEHCTATNTIPDPVKGHSMGEYYTTLEATCQKEGVERCDCDNCDYYETRDLNIVDHSYGEYISDNNASCTSDGTKTRKCIWCDLPDPVSVPDPGTMKEHSFTNYVSDGNATYDHDGTKTAKCDHCDATDTIPDPGSRLVRVEDAPLYRVIDQDGKALSCKAERKDGVLTITVEADFAALTGKLGGIQTLKAQGIDTIVFVTNGATSAFALSDLLAQTGDTYTLTHDGSTVTFTMNNGGDVSAILQ